MKHSILLFLAIVTSFSVGAENLEQRIASAKALAAANQHTQAAADFDAILKKMPAKHPQREAITADRIYSLWASGNYADTIRAAKAFTAEYTQSNFGFNVHYLMAISFLALQKPEQALKPFLDLTFEQLRELEEDPRTKISELLAQSFRNLGKHGCAEMVLADRTDLFKGADGKPFMAGTMKALQDRNPSEKDVLAKIETIPSVTDRIKLKKLLGLDGKGSLSYKAGLAFLTDSFEAVAMSEKAVQVTGDVFLPLTEARSGLLGQIRFDVLPFGATVAGESFRLLQLDGKIKGSLYAGSSGFRLIGYLGAQYRVSVGASASLAYSHAMGPSMGLEMRYPLGFGSVGASLLYSFLNPIRQTISAANQSATARLDWEFAGFFEKLNAVYLEYDITHFSAASTTTQVHISRIGLGYQILF